MDVLDGKPKTAAALAHLVELLRCSKCTAIPHNSVYTPFDCEHKYCETCAPQNDSECFVCNADYTGCEVDAVFTGFLRKLDPAMWGMEVSVGRSQHEPALSGDPQKENKEGMEELESMSSDNVVYSDDDMDLRSASPKTNRNKRSCSRIRNQANQEYAAKSKSLEAALPQTRSRQETSNEDVQETMVNHSKRGIVSDKPVSPLKPINSKLPETVDVEQRKIKNNKQLKEIFGLDSEDDDEIQVQSKQFEELGPTSDKELAQQLSQPIEFEPISVENDEATGEHGNDSTVPTNHSLRFPSHLMVSPKKVEKSLQVKTQQAPSDTSDKQDVSCRADSGPAAVCTRNAAETPKSSERRSEEVVKPRKFFKSRGNLNEAPMHIETKKTSIAKNKKVKQTKNFKSKQGGNPCGFDRQDPPKSAKASPTLCSESLTGSFAREPKEVEDFKTTTTRSRLSRSSCKKSPYIESEDEHANDEFAEKPRKRPNSPKTTGARAGVKERKRNASVSSNSSLNGSFRSTTPKGRKSRNQKGETPLHVAARNGNAAKIQMLLEEGLDVNAKDFADWTPLHEAINSKHPHIDIVKLLCGAGADVNALGGGEMTPLHEAARLGLSTIVEFLLSRKASPALRNIEGKLPRDVATEDVTKIIDSYMANSAASQSTNDTIQLKASLAKAVYFFNYEEDKECLKRCCGTFLGMKVSAKLTKDVTHIIFNLEPGTPLSIDRAYIHGMALGALMITKDWIDSSVVAKHLVDPREFEIPACLFPNGVPSSTSLNADGIIRSRENKELKNPGLLQGISIHLFKSTSWPSSSSAWESQTAEGFRMNKKELQDLIRLAGGHVVNREPDPETVDPFSVSPRFHAEKDVKFAIICHITLYDENNEPPIKHALEHVKTLKVDWLVHSIVHFKLLNPEPYY